MDPTAFHLVVDELQRLYGIPLAAPRAFLRTSQRSHRAAAAPASRMPPPLMASAPSGQAAQPPSQLRTTAQRHQPPMMDIAAGPSPLAAAFAAGSNGAPAAVHQDPAVQAAAGLGVLGSAIGASTHSGFLTWSAASVRRSGQIDTASALQSTSTPVADSAVKGGGAPPLQHQRTGVPFPTPAAEPQLDYHQTEGGHLISKQEDEVELMAARVREEVADPHEEPLRGAPGGGSVRMGSTDFAAMPPGTLATFLQGCASRKVPLRRSVLQSYSEVVSYRALDLTASELVSVLEGLSKYHLTPGLAPAAAGSASGSSSAAGTSRSAATAGRRPVTRPTAAPPGWEDPILSALLSPLRDPRRDGSATAADADARPPTSRNCRSSDVVRGVSGSSSDDGSSNSGRRRGANREGWTGGSSSGNGSSGSGSTGGGGGGNAPHGSRLSPGLGSSPRVAQLAPGQAVQLIYLLVQLDVRPAPRWVGAFLKGTAHLLPRMSGGELIRLLELLTTLEAAPEAAWWDAVLDCWPVEGGTGLTHGSAAAHTSASPSSVERPLALDVRSAILYCISVCGPPRGAGASALATRLSSWAEAALYDMAWAALRSGQLARDAVGRGAAAGEMAQAAKGAERHWLRGVEGAAAATAKSSDGEPIPGAGAAGAESMRGSGAGPPPSPPRPPPRPPPASAMAQALAALPAVMPRRAARWASAPGGPGRGVLAVLVTALEPRLRELPPELLVDLLRGFAASRLHPGPRFLRLHALVLKRRSAELPPEQLLTVAQCYREMGQPVRGQVRAAVLQARAALRKEATKYRPGPERAVRRRS